MGIEIDACRILVEEQKGERAGRKKMTRADNIKMYL
jgi:hypothetical protein